MITILIFVILCSFSKPKNKMITGVFKLDQFLFKTNKIQDKICLQLNSL